MKELKLSMSDLRDGAEFLSANLGDVRTSLLPVYEADIITLSNPRGEKRVLKNRLALHEQP